LSLPFALADKISSTIIGAGTPREAALLIVARAAPRIGRSRPMAT
jgi:hypothetical protein